MRLPHPPAGIAAGLLLLLLAGCETTPEPSGATVTLPGTAWRVEDIEGAGVAARVKSTVVFESPERVVGSTGCNGYFGPLTLSGDRVSFGRLATTRRSCPASVMEQERRFLSAMGRVQRYSSAGGCLELSPESGPPVLRLCPLSTG
jgi:heat shock protein HslJ